MLVKFGYSAFWPKILGGKVTLLACAILSTPNFCSNAQNIKNDANHSLTNSLSLQPLFCLYFNGLIGCLFCLNVCSIKFNLLSLFFVQSCMMLDTLKIVAKHIQFELLKILKDHMTLLWQKLLVVEILFKCFEVILTLPDQNEIN